MEKYFENSSQLVEFLVEELGFSTEDAYDYMSKGMAGYSEEPHKRSVLCSGYILNTKTGYYYSLYFDCHYDYGSSDFTLDTTPLQMKEEIQTITVKKFVPITKE